MQEGDIVELKTDYTVRDPGRGVGMLNAGCRGIIHTTISDGLPSTKKPSDCILIVYGDPADFSVKVPLNVLRVIEDHELEKHFELRLRKEKERRFFNDLVCMACLTNFSRSLPLCTKCGLDTVHDPHVAEKFTELYIADSQGNPIVLNSLIAHGRAASVFKGYNQETKEVVAVKIARITSADRDAEFGWTRTKELHAFVANEASRSLIKD